MMLLCRLVVVGLVATTVPAAVAQAASVSAGNAQGPSRPAPVVFDLAAAAPAVAQPIEPQSLAGVPNRYGEASDGIQFRWKLKKVKLKVPLG